MTVKQRIKHHGLKASHRERSKIGVQIDTYWQRHNLTRSKEMADRVKREEKINGKMIMTWDYPEYFTIILDEVILNHLKK